MVRWLFLRILGAVYLVAFTSLRAQVLGLYGARGIEPLRERLANLRARAGRGAYRLAPSLLWLGSSDRDLVRFCQAGQVCALAAMLGLAPGKTVVGAWALYLSFVSVDRNFLAFQWDTLLLEAGAHGALVAARPAFGNRSAEVPWLGTLLMRWLVFRLHLQSGLVKLRSHDETWRRCTACAYHYETQPLPTPLGWYAFHLPKGVQTLSTGAVLAIELGAPFLTFLPRPLRRAGFWALFGLQGLIAATGNYAFFNVLTVALELWVLDDDSFHRLRRLFPDARRPTRAHGFWRGLPGRVTYAAVSAVVAIASLTTFASRYHKLLDGPLARLTDLIAPFRSVNAYGLFAVMTTVRPEIVIEGSNDGFAWREYRFRYKPSRPKDPPRWVAPHQPRLDWQMWFAALGRPPAWFTALLARLLEGSPDVLRLLGENPFPDQPPRYVRALLYEFRMTDLATRKRTGAWWRRKLLGSYYPVCGLDSRRTEGSDLKARSNRPA